MLKDRITYIQHACYSMITHTAHLILKINHELAMAFLNVADICMYTRTVYIQADYI